MRISFSSTNQCVLTLQATLHFTYNYKAKLKYQAKGLCNIIYLLMGMLSNLKLFLLWSVTAQCFRRTTCVSIFSSQFIPTGLVLRNKDMKNLTACSSGLGHSNAGLLASRMDHVNGIHYQFFFCFLNF